MARKADIFPASEAGYQKVIEFLLAGKLVALPTETVYGLAAMASDDEAVQSIYRAKGRPSHNPLIAHICHADAVHELAEVSPLAEQLINQFWPGPLTLVLPKKTDANISRHAGAKLKTIAVRFPDAPWTEPFHALGFNAPIVMPSANISGHISPTTAQHVFEDLGDKIDLILDAGPCKSGVESTVLAVCDDHITLLRPGAIPAEDFAPFISDMRLPKKSAQPIAPGMLESHYAPRATVRLNAVNKRNGEAYLAFGPTDIKADLNLSEVADLDEASHNLYAYLRTLDKTGVKSIAIAPIPLEGLGGAINDRLKRAAADR
jgi:L-threonylcarbamoyladenylate synthase